MVYTYTFQQLIILLCVTFITDQIHSNLREAFILFDVNRDGRITETELESVLGFLGVKTTRDEVRRMIQDADCDGM
uniref:Calmodulin-like protein 8 n=1 Tax=Schistosoma haematobium TaxID=6185 RepID=A0A094ZR95_SCHHA